MFDSTLRSVRNRAALFACIALGLSLTMSPMLRADSQTKTTGFELTGGDFKLISFRPAAAGIISAEADFSPLGKSQGNAIIRMQLLRPDGTLAKQVVGASPLRLNFGLSAAEEQKFKGKSFQIRLSDDANPKGPTAVKGQVKLTT